MGHMLIEGTSVSIAVWMETSYAFTTPPRWSPTRQQIGLNILYNRPLATVVFLFMQLVPVALHNDWIDQHVEAVEEDPEWIALFRNQAKFRMGILGYKPTVPRQSAVATTLALLVLQSSFGWLCHRMFPSMA